MSREEKIICIVGPTASGKTALAVDVAKRHNGEIICADSRTIYKGLDIGTAKPTGEEQQGILHHGLDLVEPNEVFTAADFQKLAKSWVRDIRGRGKLPIVVGGTGLYIDGLIYDFEFGEPADITIRKELELLSIEELQQRITELGYEMPENYNNRRYLIRVLEQGRINRKKQPLGKGVTIVGLDPGKEVLESRITARAKAMFENGVIEEAEWLGRTYGFDSPAASGTIYRAISSHFLVSKSLEECFEDALRADRRFAKRQRTWLKRNPDINWFNEPDSAKRFIARALAPKR